MNWKINQKLSLILISLICLLFLDCGGLPAENETEHYNDIHVTDFPISESEKEINQRRHAIIYTLGGASGSSGNDSGCAA